MLLYTHSPLKFAFAEAETGFGKKSLHENDETQSNYKFGIVGVPFDSTSSYKPGARFGPRSIREASYNFERYNLIFDKVLDVPICDFGDVEIVHGNFKKTCDNLRSTVSEIIANDIIPIIIGGEHTVSFSVLKAFDVKEMTIIHFDAHMDLRDRYLDEKYSHATVMRRIADLKPMEIIQFGIRSSSEEEAIFAEENQIKYYTPHEINQDLKEIKQIISSVKGQIYVSVDMDVFDPAYAPSVGNPVPCGLKPTEMESLIHSLNGRDVIGLDLVEVSSTHIGDITSINGAKVIYDFLCLQ